MNKLRERLNDLDCECGLPSALEVMGERWAFMILRASFNHIVHFEDFLDSLGIARNILSNRLARLVDADIMQRQPCAEDRRKIEYRLTQKGLDLLPAMIALRQWGEKWNLGVASNPVLVDNRDWLPIAQVRLHAADGRAIGPADLCWSDKADVGHGDRIGTGKLPEAAE